MCSSFVKISVVFYVVNCYNSKLLLFVSSFVLVLIYDWLWLVEQQSE
jgi:hypothetical protein